MTSAVERTRKLAIVRLKATVTKVMNHIGIEIH